MSKPLDSFQDMNNYSAHPEKNADELNLQAQQHPYFHQNGDSLPKDIRDVENRKKSRNNKLGSLHIH